MTHESESLPDPSHCHYYGDYYGDYCGCYCGDYLLIDQLDSVARYDEQSVAQSGISEELSSRDICPV